MRFHYFSRKPNRGSRAGVEEEGCRAPTCPPSMPPPKRERSLTKLIHRPCSLPKGTRPRSSPGDPGTAPTTATHSVLLAQALGPRGPVPTAGVSAQPATPGAVRAARGLQGSRRAGPGGGRGRPSLGRAEEVARETRRAERAAAAASPAPPPRPGLLGRHAAPSAPQAPPLGAAEPTASGAGAAARGQEVPPPRHVISAARRPGRSRWCRDAGDGCQGRRGRGCSGCCCLLRWAEWERRSGTSLGAASKSPRARGDGGSRPGHSCRGAGLTDDAIYHWLFHSTSIFIEHLPETNLESAVTTKHYAEFKGTLDTE